MLSRPCRHPRAPRPGPGLLYVAQLWLSLINFACNSPAACSNIEFASLELQRFLGLLKFGLIELHAKFVCLGPCRRLSNFARNSLATCLNIEISSLELQRFRVVSKSDRGKLCAKLIWCWPCEPVLALPTGRSLHRSLALRSLRTLRRPRHQLGWVADG